MKLSSKLLIFSNIDGDDTQNMVVSVSYIQLKQLKPYTNYSIYLRAYSKQGASGNSETVLVQTKQDGKLACNFLSRTLHKIKIHCNDFSHLDMK